MTIYKSKLKEEGKIKVDLSGPEGNAFWLLGYAKRLCSQLDKEWEPIREEMTSGDYDNLIEIFDREFGEYVDLYRG